MQFDKISTTDIRVGDYIRYTSNGAPIAGTVATVTPLTFETKDTVWAADAKTIANLQRLNLDDYKEIDYADIKVGQHIMYMSGDLIKPGGQVTKRYKFYNTAMLEIKLGPNTFQASAVKMQKIWLRRSEPIWQLTKWADIRVGNYVKYWDDGKYLYGGIATIREHDYVLDGSGIAIARTPNVWVRRKKGDITVSKSRRVVQSTELKADTRQHTEPPTVLKADTRQHTEPPISLQADYVLITAPEAKTPMKPLIGVMPSHIVLANSSHAKLLARLKLEGEMRFVWRHDHARVCVTTHHIFKMEDPRLTIVKLSDIVSVSHKRNGWFEWDHIIFKLKTGTESIGVYDAASTAFIIKNLAAPGF